MSAPPASSSALPDSAPPEVTILMATRNGAAHLEAQLASFAAQTGVRWRLWVSDDGSDDDTRALLEAFRARTGQPERLFDGPGRGAAANFLSLLCHPDLEADPSDLPGPVALADQDDLWYPEKLAAALAALEGVRGPAVYSARSRHVDTQGRPVGVSRGHAGPASFGNALVENRVSGHAAVLNAEALALVRRAGPVRVPFHDWWLYLLVTGAGGTVICDPKVRLDYRQHGGNVLGAPRGALALLRRMALVLSARGPVLRAANLRALERARPLLTPEARALLDALETAPRFGPGRVRALKRLGVRRGTQAAQTFLQVAAFLGRV